MKAPPSLKTTLAKPQGQTGCRKDWLMGCSPCREGDQRGHARTRYNALNNQELPRRKPKVRAPNSPRRNLVKLSNLQTRKSRRPSIGQCLVGRPARRGMHERCPLPGQPPRVGPQAEVSLWLFPGVGFKASLFAVGIVQGISEVFGAGWHCCGKRGSGTCARPRRWPGAVQPPLRRACCGFQGLMLSAGWDSSWPHKARQGSGETLAFLR